MRAINHYYSAQRITSQMELQEEELLALLKARPHPVCYDGFEPSGRMHIAQGIYKAILVNKLTAAGCVFKFWVADWFALLNNKMGGDLKKIQTVGRYMIEVRKFVATWYLYPNRCVLTRDIAGVESSGHEHGKRRIFVGI
jgi:tyrosyl-tRNA synthetase